VHQGHETSAHYFHARLGLVQVPQKVRQDTLGQTCVFASGGICRSRSAYRCVQGTKPRCTIFHAWVGPVRIEQNARRDTLHRSLFLHPVGYVGHVVHFGASGVRIIDALLFMLGWDQFRFNKKQGETLCCTCVFTSDWIYGSRSAFWYVRGVKHQRTDRYRLNKKRVGICYTEFVFYIWWDLWVT
jgi:hypothetical protein